MIYLKTLMGQPLAFQPESGSGELTRGVVSLPSGGDSAAICYTPGLSEKSVVLRGVLTCQSGYVAFLAPAELSMDQADIMEIALRFPDISPRKAICTTEFSCGACIYTRGHGIIRYLVLRAVKGHTGFPKGHREPGETPEQTALREVREETGLQISLIHGFLEESVYHPDPFVEKRVRIYLAQVHRPRLCLQPEEIASADFLTYDRAMELLDYDNDRRILTAADRFLRSGK